MDDILNRAKKTKCYGFINKPFSETEVTATIQKAISKHNSEQD